jgi:hypothetical protein
MVGAADPAPALGIATVGGAGAGRARTRADEARRRLNQLAARQRWVHHVGDLAAGDVVTSELDRPVTPLSRAARLERAGVRLTPPRFSGPSFRLTPRAPYQASPEAYLDASNATLYLPFADTIIWEVPADHDYIPGLALNAYFLDFPSDPAVLSVELAAKAWPGRTGHVEFRAYKGAAKARIPIGEQFAAHTIDLDVPPPSGPSFFDATMLIEPGVELLKFSEISFRAGIIFDGVLVQA